MRLQPAKTLQYTAAHCNTLQHTATHCNTLATHCNTLQHTTTHCNTLQYTATCRNTSSCPMILQPAITTKIVLRYSKIHQISKHIKYTGVVQSGQISVCCSEVQCAAAKYSRYELNTSNMSTGVVQGGQYSVCCSEVQCAAAKYSRYEKNISSMSTGVVQSGQNLHNAMSCSVLRCVAVCCSVVQCVAMCHSVLQRVAACFKRAAACCSVLQQVTVCCSSQDQWDTSSYVAVCCMLQLLQCVAVFCSGQEL